MHWRREQLSTASHHSFDMVHAEHAAPRSQKTGTRAGEGEVHEKHDGPRAQNRPLPGMRPAPIQEPRPQVGIQRHTGIGYELVLNPVVP